MDAGEFRQRIRSAATFLTDEINIARSVSSLVSLAVDPEFNDVALDTSSSYRDIYLRAVSRSYYNIILNDYSIYQFSWSSTESWRLAYLPNPWITGVDGAAELVQEWENLESLGAYDQEDVASLISELPYFGSVPPLRFEYSADQYRDLSHPCAHVHIGRHSGNRWAFSKDINPFSFVLMITKQYYNEYWAPRSEYYGGESMGCLDARLIDELERSRRVHNFTENEQRSVHFSAR